MSQQLSESPEKTKQQALRRETQPAPAKSFQAGLHPILQLQHTLGNRRVAKLIQAKRLTPEGRIIGLQPKLTVGAADDQYEQEADRVARQVVSMPDSAVLASFQSSLVDGHTSQAPTLQSKLLPLAASITPFVQRRMGAEEETEEDQDKEGLLQAKFFNKSVALPLQRQPATEEGETEETKQIQTRSAGSPSDSFEAGDDVESRINQSKGGGSQLPDSVRAYMEPRFGVDFSHVHVHTGSEAIHMNRDVGAQAFTHGSDIYYGAGSSPGNLGLTAHELTHVVQQTGGRPLQAKQLNGAISFVQQRVGRRKSTEALLDSCASYRFLGSLTVQRQTESRTLLQAALDSADEATDLDATIEALEALHPGRTDRDREYTIPINGADHHIAGRDVRHLLNRSRARRRRLGSGEWNQRSSPRPGHTIYGNRIEENNFVEVESIRLRLIRSHGRWGVAYYSTYDSFRAAAERAAADYDNNHQPFRAAAARGSTVMHEGGVGAINTYDGMVFTLGPGYTGGRLAHALEPLRGTPAGDALAAVTGHHGIAYMAGLRFNRDARVRTDVVALARMVKVVELDHPIDFAEAWIKDVVERDALVGSNAERTGNAIASHTIPEVVGVAEYLHHGYGDYAGSPAARVADAIRTHADNPSAQMAYILRRYAEACAHDRTSNPLRYAERVGSIIQNRLPNKVPHFIDAARGRDPSFHFDLAAAQRVIRCLNLRPPWQYKTTVPTGLYLDLELDGEHRYWDFDEA